MTLIMQLQTSSPTIIQTVLTIVITSQLVLIQSSRHNRNMEAITQDLSIKQAISRKSKIWLRDIIVARNKIINND